MGEREVEGWREREGGKEMEREGGGGGRDGGTEGGGDGEGGGEGGREGGERLEGRERETGREREERREGGLQIDCRRRPGGGRFTCFRPSPPPPPPPPPPPLLRAGPGPNDDLFRLAETTSCLARFGSIRPDSDRFGSIRIDSARSGSIRIYLFGFVMDSGRAGRVAAGLRRRGRDFHFMLGLT